jgi:glycosyltransferase involved in cell wall biosynthesis
MIDSRSHLKPEWVKKAIGSVEEQTLGGIELIVLDNKERTQSIGRVYNQGVELAKADWVYFLGDDDFLSVDYLASLKAFIDKYADEDTVCCSTYSTFFDDEKRVMSINTMTPMGAFKREYLLENKLREDIAKYIDVEIYKRFDAQGKKAKICRWHFGYYYRQHGDNVSGRKNIKPVPKD